jgi:DNA-binding MarR family transcriptional regulator
MKPATIPTDPWTKFALSIFKLNGLINEAGEAIARPIGQSSARWHILGRVCVQPQTVAQMARNMGHARQSVQRIADILVKEKLVVYKTHPKDHRTKLVEATPQGMKVMTTIYTRQVAWSEKIMSQLNPKQLVAIADALATIGKIIEKDVNKKRKGVTDK